MKKINVIHTIGIILSVLIGITFLFSAYAKLPSLEQFGWTVVETTFFNWTFSEWIVRLLVVLEFTLGLAFIFQFELKKIISPIAFFLLLIFNVYLILIWKQYGNTGNCGCFGDLLPMTPLASLVKNCAMMLGIFVVWRIGFQFSFPYSKIIVAILFLSVLSLLLWKSPPESIFIQEKEMPLHDPIPLSILYNSPNNEAPKLELRKGKHIISFLSLTCSFCRKAAKRMRIMKEKYPTLPFYFVLNGDSTDLNHFYEDTKSENIDYVLFNGPQEFVKMNGDYSLPSIKWIEDTTVVRKSNYLSLDEQEILEWLKESK